MHTTDLVFQAGAVTLVDDGRRHENQQVSLCPNIAPALKEITEERHISDERNLGAGLEHFILEQTADRQGVTALDQDI